MTDDKVAVDEARRASQHARVKSDVEREVNSEITAQATRPAVVDRAGVNAAAGEFRDRTIKETVHAEHEVARARGVARGSQFVDYAFYVAYSLLLVRLVLALIAANSTSGFVRFIDAVTNPLYAPFRGIVQSPTTPEGNTFALPVVIAMGAYVVLHLMINGALRLFAHRKTQI